MPNTNVADALGRLPGVSLERDEGEGKYIQIRGTEPRLSNVTINGVRITSPESDGLTWTAYKGGAQKFDGSGPYEMAFDSVNGILYASMWFQGVWALKVTPP